MSILFLLHIFLTLSTIISYQNVIFRSRTNSLITSNTLFAIRPPNKSRSWSSTYGNRGKLNKPKPKSTSNSNTNDSEPSLPDGKERLQKVISNAGITSRRNAEKYILDGRVTLNGKMVTEVGVKVDPTKDIINVDGKRLTNISPENRKIFWIVMNKPRNTLTTTSDDKDRDTVIDLIPMAKDLRLLPVGRLERDTTGVLILTNENNWIHPLTHPSYTLQKTYEVIVQGMPSEIVLNSIRNDFMFTGIYLTHNIITFNY